MRLKLVGVTGLALLPAIAGCGGQYVKHALPVGLTYDCGGQPAIVAYNGQGYLPGNSVRTPYTGIAQELVQAPRATAKLWYGGREYRMMADLAENGLRYRSVEPVSDTHALVWAADGESASISEVPVMRTAEERRVADCTRTRTVAGAGTPGAAAH